MHAFIVLMALGIVVLDVAIIVCIVGLFSTKWNATIRSFAQHYGLLAIFLLSAGSVAGTMFMQYAALLTPCVLCWWQRIFMYPTAITALITLIKGKRVAEIADYVIVFSILGGTVSLYQHLLQILPSGSLIPCDASNDCAIRLVFEFGFVTIPWMALTVFVALALVAVLARKE